MAVFNKKFRFTFNIRGVETYELKNAPKDWEKTTVTYKRSDTYKGILKSLALPFGFLYKSAGILRREFYTDGLLANVKMAIDKINPSTQVYKNIYKGKFDFSQFEDEEYSVTIPSTQDDISIKISAFDNVKYNIPLDVADAVDVVLTPIKLKEKADFIFVPSQQDQQAGYPALQIVNNEQSAVTASVRDAGYRTDLTPDFATDSDWFYEAQTDTNLRIEITDLQGFVQSLSVQGPNRFRLQLVNNSGIVLATLFDYNIATLGSVPFNITTSLVFDLSVGQKVFLYQRLDGPTDSDTGFNYTNGQLSLNYLTESPATQCKALRASYVFDQLVQLINGKDTGGAYTPYPTQSRLLTGALNNLVITSSNSIRQIPPNTQYEAGDTLSAGSKYVVINFPILYGITTYNVGDTFTATQDLTTFTSPEGGSVLLISFNQVLQYSFKDFYQSILAVQGGNISFGLDGGVSCLETLDYVYRSQLFLLNLGNNRRNVKINPAVDLLANSIKVGYTDQQYDSLNGTQEVNSEQVYKTDLTTPVKQLDLVSPTRADPFGIEQLRVTPVDTASSRSDNDNYFIWIKDNPEIGQTYYQPLRWEGLQSITGIDAALTYYNWKITPKQNLLRGGAYLASIFYGLKGYRIKFTSAAKNFNLVTIDLAGNRVAEGEDIIISSLPAPIFIPYNVELSTDLPYNALDFLESRYYGVIDFEFRGYTLSGFIDEVSVDAGQNSTRDYKLLLTPNNNLLNLVK